MKEEESAYQPKYDALALLRKLEWRVRDAADSVLGGDYRSAFRGRGREFDQVVRYEWGDDVRDIDWNVTARLGEPYRKKYVEEREMTLLLLFEDTVSLQFGSGERSKRDALMEVAGLLSLLCSANRDRLGVLHVRPDGYHYQKPVRGRRAIMHATASLMSGVKPKLFHEAPDVGVPWRLISKSLPKHTVLLWLGDFPIRAKPDGWSVLQRRYEVLGFRVDDAWERELPRMGVVNTFDPMTGDFVLLDTADREHRREHEEWVARRDGLFQQWFPSGLNRMHFLADDPVLDVMLNFFRARMRRGVKR